MTSKSQRRPARKRQGARGRPLVAIVASLSEARIALAQGARSRRAVVLFSPPDAAAYLGVGFFWALIEAARGEFAGVAVEGVMDCGDAPGWALAALRTGFKAIVLGGNAAARRRVAAIARASGAKLVARPRAAAPRAGA